MALTKISTDGVKDDAVTAGKIPANAVGSSELADNAVDTAAIADDAVTAAKLASNAVVNASVDASAAIAGTKIAPDFGSQNLVSTGTSNALGTTTIKGGSNAAARLLLQNTTSVRTNYIGLSGDDDRIVIAADDANQGSNSTIDFKVDGTERMRIDSSGNVGIGMTPSGMRLDLTATANDVARFSGANSGSMTFRNDTNHEMQIHTGASDALIFGTNGENERMRIDSSGKLGIGTTSPVRQLHVNDSAHVKHLLLDNGAGGSDVGTTPAIYSPASATLAFSGGSAERLRIDSSGNVGISNPSPTGWGTGIPTVEFKGTSNTSRGGAIAFESHSGSNGYNVIYSDNGDLRIYTGATNRASATEKVMFPRTGGITFNGDTAAANALDDYEEGEYTVTVSPNSGSITLQSAQDTFAYTKIGRLVTINGRVDVSSVSSPSGELTLSLPFNVMNGTDLAGSGAASLFIYNATSGNAGDWVGWSDDTNNKLYLRLGNGIHGSGGSQYIQYGTEFRVTYTYMTS